MIVCDTIYYPSKILSLQLFSNQHKIISIHISLFNHLNQLCLYVHTPARLRPVTSAHGEPRGSMRLLNRDVATSPT